MLFTTLLAPVFSYGQFQYTPDSVNALLIQEGKSKAPTIDWQGGNAGTFSMSPTIKEVSIDSSTGVISWTSSLASGTHKLTVMASNTMGTVTNTYTLTNKTPDKPSYFYYNPSKVVSNSPKAGESKPTLINWNLNQSTFEITNNPNSQNISIDNKTGVIKWSANLKPQIYILEVVAINKLGLVSTSLTIDRIKTPIIPPTPPTTNIPPDGFDYTKNVYTFFENQSEQTEKPNINWNGDEGNFMIGIQQNEKLTIDTKSGILRWSSGLLPGTYDLMILATNSAGSVSTTISLVVKKVVKAPTGLSYIPNTHLSAHDQSGQSSIPFVDWHGDQGKFFFRKPNG